jgi:hypothetical protein
VGDAHDVWPAVDLDVPCVGQRGVQPPALAVDRVDPVGGTVQDQHRDVDARDVAAEVSSQPGGHAQVAIGEASAPAVSSPARCRR